MEQQIDYTKPYITRDEYLKAKGIDLNIEIQDDDNKSNKVKRFIKDITDFIMNKLAKEYGDNDLNRNVTDFSTLAEFRRKRFHEGMIEEIEYVLNNGLVHQDSGINKELGVVIDYSKVIISISAHDAFFLGGFCNIERC